MQANVAEMLRIACCLATESGVSVCAPVHDALLIESEISNIEHAVKLTQKAMAKASALVLGGHSLRTDVKLIQLDNPWTQKQGAQIWQVLEVLARNASHGNVRPSEVSLV